MDYKKLAKSAFKNAAMFRDAGDVSKAVYLILYWKAINDLLTRSEEAEARCETLEKMVKEYQETILPGYRKIANNAAEVASNICDDFIDFVTGGVYNAAPYCDNRRPECVNAHGLCNGDNKVCRGFFPKAAISRKE